MSILILGANGQVGWELQRSLQSLDKLECCGHEEANLEDFEALRRLIRSHKPKIIVNAAAYTAVDKAESEQDLAFRINADAVRVLAEESNDLDALLIHYSTDYVFDGTAHSPLKETDPTNPINTYGLSKRAGENAIMDIGCRHLIFRTSWVYSNRRQNFIKSILRLAAERDELNIVDDQIGCPTSARQIAEFTSVAIQNLNDDIYGLYHLTADGQTTWYDYAKKIVSTAYKQGLPLKLNESKIVAIATQDYPLPAKRPKYSRLNTRKLTDTFGIVVPAWEAQVEQAISEIIESGDLS